MPLGVVIGALPAARSTQQAAREEMGMANCSGLEDEKAPGCGALSGLRLPLLNLDAFFGEVLHRARMPRHRRGILLLVLELDVLGFLVRTHEVIFVVEHRLDDRVGSL